MFDVSVLESSSSSRTSDKLAVLECGGKSRVVCVDLELIES
jgi:hypothetical protein